MINYIEFLNIPTRVAISVMQLIGEILEFKGKVVPEFIKIRKYFSRKKHEKQLLANVYQTLEDVKKSVNEFNSHYNPDSIEKRNKWIDGVNKSLEQNDRLIKDLSEKLDKNNQDTLSLLVDSKRNAIINFASLVVDESKIVTREQFKRIFKIHDEYEEIIKANNLTNGETDIAFRIIKDSYEKHMRNRSFIEDIRGY